jgi:hypothetical protein
VVGLWGRIRVKEILIPKLVPKEQITIHYLYYPPVIWSNVHSHVKSDEGYAKYENVLLKKEYSKGIKFVSILIFIVGLSTIIYGLIVFIKNLIK